VLAGGAAAAVRACIRHKQQRRWHVQIKAAAAGCGVGLHQAESTGLHLLLLLLRWLYGSLLVRLLQVMYLSVLPMLSVLDVLEVCTLHQRLLLLLLLGWAW
jgi:hypothetical protein